MGEYLKNRLDIKSQALYQRIVEAGTKQLESVDCSGLSDEEIVTAYASVLSDHPELFFLSQSFKIQETTGSFGVRKQLFVERIFSKEQIACYQIALKDARKEIAEKARNCKTEKEKEKKVCEYVVGRVTYAIDNKYNQNAAVALVGGIGQCSGISKAVKYLLDSLGIECWVVSGEATNTVETGRHAWNIVKIDGKYYHLDVTFMAGAGGGVFCNRYFNYTDEQISEDHKWERSCYPICSAKTNRAPRISEAPPTPIAAIKGNERPSEKVISNYFTFRYEIGKVYEGKGTRLVFSSKLREIFGKPIVDTLIAEALAVAKEKNVAVSVNAKMQKDIVTLNVIWK